MRSEKGFTGADLTIAVIIVIIFTAMIVSVFVNIYLTNSYTNRNIMAVTYVTQIFEQIDKLYYADIPDILDFTDIGGMPEGKLKEIIAGMNIRSGYSINLKIERHEDEKEGIDLIKIISVEVEYDVGKKTESLKLQKVKQKEILVIPNKPNLVGTEYIPVKFIYDEPGETEGYFQITQQNDSAWYNYDNKVWAYAMTEVEEENGVVIDFEKLFVWIPRFGIAEDTFFGTSWFEAFLYSTTNRTLQQNIHDVNENWNLLTQEYQVPHAFEGLTGKWVEITSNITDSEYELLDTSIYGPRKEMVW